MPFNFSVQYVRSECDAAKHWAALEDVRILVLLTLKLGLKEYSAMQTCYHSQGYHC